jgi:hypothetical protein
MDERAKKQALLDKIDQKLGKRGIMDIKSEKQKRIEQMVKELVEDTDSKEEFAKTRDTMREYFSKFLVKLGVLDTLVAAIRSTKIVIPDSVTVNNLRDIPKAIIKIPDSVNIRQLSWMRDVVEDLKKEIRAIGDSVKNFKLPTGPKNGIPVRLTDGEEFYKAVADVVVQGSTGGGGGSVPTVSTTVDGIRGVPVVNPDGTNIGGGSGGDASAANQTTQIAAEQAIQSTVGAISGAAVVTDANGTLQQYLRGIVKLLITSGTIVLGAGTNAIGKLAANSGVDIGDVDVLSIAAGDNNIGNVDIASIAAGTNAIGKLAANSGVDIGDVTLTAGTAAIGTLLPPDIDITTHTNYARKYYTSAGAATDGIVWSPAAGKRWHVVALHFQVSAAATVTFEDDKAGGDDPVLKGEYAANSGEFLVFPEKYAMASGEDAADLLVTTSAGNIYVTAVGYEI